MTATERPPRPGLVALRFDGDTLWALDQTLLPKRELELPLRRADEIAEAIRRLAIRGAPLIGVAAGYGVALELLRDPGVEALPRACRTLLASRPTAVNLARAVERVRSAAERAGLDGGAEAALSEARAIHAEEERASAEIARYGAELLADRRRLLTHCNTGALAAPGAGTALAVIAELARLGGPRSVLATESRPLLQGARLTVYELTRLGIDHELIVDSAAAGLIAAGQVDAVIVGCDRVAANGDVANKVGTYQLALAADAAGIEFVVAGPTSTIDMTCPTGAEIVIEQRPAHEVRHLGAEELTLPGTRCRNPAFDITPASLITALVTDHGVARPLSQESVAALAFSQVS
jgi:methylthioribose-1-phosphate isomerase